MPDVLVIWAAVDEDAWLDAEERIWTAGLPEATAVEWSWTVRTVVFSADGSPAHGVSGVERIATWDIVPAVTEASMVHVCRPYTRAGELAVVAASALGKPLAVSHLMARTSEVGRSFGLLQLADTVICQSKDEANYYADCRDVEVLDFSADDWLAPLGSIYQRLGLRSGPGV